VAWHASRGAAGVGMCATGGVAAGPAYEGVQAGPKRNSAHFDLFKNFSNALN
jgi:hypothetical protein